MANRLANAPVKQAQIIVHLSRGANGGARIPRNGLLLNRNRRRNTRNNVHIGFVHSFQKLPRICRKRFHEAALPFGVDRIECKRGFAGTAYTGDDHKFIARDVERHVFQIMLPGTAHSNNAAIAACACYIAVC
jgi:hypothetical protein